MKNNVIELLNYTFSSVEKNRKWLEKSVEISRIVREYHQKIIEEKDRKFKRNKNKAI